MREQHEQDSNAAEGIEAREKCVRNSRGAIGQRSMIAQPYALE
jgi:hypothetical protein